MTRVPRLVVASASQGQPFRPIYKPAAPHLSQGPSSLRPDGVWSLRSNFINKSVEDRTNQEPSTSGRPSFIPQSGQRTQLPNRQQSFASEELSKAGALSRSTAGSLDEAGSPSNWRTARVRFWLKFRTEFGQSVRVVGSHEQLGSWNLLSAPRLTWSEGDLWNVTIDLPIGGVFEYKYAVVASDGRSAAAWQRGNNSVIAIRQDDTELEVFDNWEGNPGAAVVAGGTSTTREGRLLNWASEMEAILTAQRNELRETRMQLFEAQEEARSARQDAVQLRTDLILATQARLEAERKLSVTEVENSTLRMELSRKSYEFKMALEECRRLLEEVTGVDAEPEPTPAAACTKTPPTPSIPTTPTTPTAQTVPGFPTNGKDGVASKLPFSNLFSAKNAPPPAGATSPRQSSTPQPGPRSPATPQPSPRQLNIQQPGQRPPTMQQPVQRQPGMQRLGQKPPSMQQPIQRQPSMQPPIVQQPSQRQPTMQQPGQRPAGMPTQAPPGADRKFTPSAVHPPLTRSPTVPPASAKGQGQVVPPPKHLIKV